MPAGHLIAGATGEDAAVRFLEQKGYTIRERNWRQASYELDIVCLAPKTGFCLFGRNKTGARGGELVFVEVKTRSLSAFGNLESAAAAFSPGKQRSLAKAVALYLSAHNAWNQPCRMDLVCVGLEQERYKVEHYKNVLDFGNVVGGGDAAWQPW